MLFLKLRQNILKKWGRKRGSKNKWVNSDGDPELLNHDYDQDFFVCRIFLITSAILGKQMSVAICSALKF